MAVNKLRAVSYEDFVIAWQTSESASEVAQRLGVSRHSASDRAKLMRSKGVKLKSFTANPYGGITPERVKALNALLEEMKED